MWFGARVCVEVLKARHWCGMGEHGIRQRGIISSEGIERLCTHTPFVYGYAISPTLTGDTRSTIPLHFKMLWIRPYKYSQVKYSSYCKDGVCRGE